jgi:hypothetical protein
MPSNDIDGSVIVILSEAEAKRVYEYLSVARKHIGPLDPLEQKLADKIARDLELPPLPESK